MTPEQHKKHKILIKDPTFIVLKKLLKEADSKGLLEDTVWDLIMQTIDLSSQDSPAYWCTQLFSHSICNKVIKHVEHKLKG